MAEVKLTPAKLAELKKKAKACHHEIWEEDFYSEEDAAYIAEADPATVLAMVEEISILRRALRELAWDHYTTDLDQNEIEEICNKLICVAKMQIESEAGQ